MYANSQHSFAYTCIQEQKQAQPTTKYTCDNEISLTVIQQLLMWNKSPASIIGLAIDVAQASSSCVFVHCVVYSQLDWQFNTEDEKHIISIIMSKVSATHHQRCRMKSTH